MLPLNKIPVLRDGKEWADKIFLMKQNKMAMKKLILFCLFCSSAAILVAQKQTFDLVSFTPPKGWTKEEKQNVMVYTRVDNKNKTWCQIGVYKSTVSKGSIEDDLQSEWNEMAVKPYNISDTMQASETQEAEGWKIKSASGKFTFNNQPAAVLITTFSGYDRCTSIVATTNSQEYLDAIENFVGSIDLKKPEVNTQQPNVGNVPVIGSWGKSNAVSQINNRFGNYSYNKQQYTFNADGSYSFAAKTYDERSSETYLIKERGRFVISGNAITLTPKSSVIEAWSKKNGGDNWNQLKSTQKRKLETVTYQFRIADKNLLLQTDRPTERDGRFTNGNTYTYGPPGSFTPIKLPGQDVATSEEKQKETVKQATIQANTSVAKSGFAFTTTNFDDGWTSTVQEDWVEVTKGSMKVLLHYPKEGTIFPADPEPLVNAAWNILVAPRYSNLKNYRTTYITTYNRPYLGMGYATENATGKNVFIVFFRQGSSGWIELVAPDKNSFIDQFKFDPETIQWDSNSDLMIPLVNMTGYNKFAVAASDLKGKWTSDFTGIQQLYNVYTGEYAGMNMNQSNEEFVFSAGNSYNWKLLVVNGMVGNAKYTEVKSAGQFSVPNNWQIYFSKIETGPRTFHAFWSCIKGARILNLLDANAPGSGMYTKYGLAK